jgi:hypothetical protein
MFVNSLVFYDAYNVRLFKSIGSFKLHMKEMCNTILKSEMEYENSKIKYLLLENKKKI